MIDDAAWRDPVRAPRPNYEIGDALYFPDGPPLSWRLRPALQSDISIVHRAYVVIGPQSWFLVRCWPRIGVFRWFLELPEGHRENNILNVNFALRLNEARQPGTLKLAKRYDALSAAMSATFEGSTIGLLMRVSNAAWVRARISGRSLL